MILFLIQLKELICDAYRNYMHYVYQNEAVK